MGGRQIALVLGTRPELIKLAKIARLLGDGAMVVHTGQHYDDNLRGLFLRELGVGPDHTLEIGGRSRGEQIGNAIAALDELFAAARPAAVVVQGDTNTALAGAIAANANEIPLVHVEAGLRSFDRAMPEEHNRIVVDHLADLCLAPTEVSRRNLLDEGIPDARILVTGNTVVEAVQANLPGGAGRAELLAHHGLERDAFVLSTFHRPENVDEPEPLAEILTALAALPVPVLLPLHPRTRARVRSFGLDALLGEIHETDPIGYGDFLGLAAECALLASDSGGVQEEVSVLKRPLVVVRRSTERPEVMGTFADLVPADAAAIEAAANAWLADPSRRAGLSAVPCPYGDGSASTSSVAAIRSLLGA